MFAIVTCLTTQHNPWLVVLAAALCFLSNTGSMMFLRNARKSVGGLRWTWLSIMGVAGGFGIWSTHFVAMLAYDPGMVVGYDPELTILSLGVSLLSALVAGLAALFLPKNQSAVAAGLVFGIGVAAMHFVGMAGLEVPGSVAWDQSLVITALVLSGLFAIIGFWTAENIARPIKRVVISSSILSLGIVAMHFTAMSALSLGAGEALNETDGLSKTYLVLTIIAVSVSLLASGISIAVIALHAARKTKDSEDKFELLIQGVTDYAIYMLDPDGLVTNWNAGAERSKGYKSHEIVGQHFSVFYSQQERAEELPRKALSVALQNGRFEANGWRCRKDGSAFWANVVIQPIFDEKKQHLGYAKITRDVTAQKEDRDHIAAVSKNLDLALENMTQGICLFDRDERLILSNQRYRDLFNFKSAKIEPGTSYWDIVKRGYEIAMPNDDGALEKAATHYQRHRDTIRSGAKSLVHKTGEGRSILANFNLMADGGWVATFEDITERLRSEEQIAFLAKHDSLTKLPNRTALADFLRHEVALANQTAGKVAVIGIDLNKFKMINDQMGHNVGDMVLIELAGRLTEQLLQGELVARIGGDEFTAIKRYTDISEVHEFLTRLNAALNEPMVIGDHKVSPGASVGVALFPQDGTATEVLLANSDLAMYRAKNSISQKVCFYDGAMDEMARDRAKLAKDLWEGVENKQFRLHYQVQKSVATGDITGYEVLLRWHHPERGNVPPMDFINVAEECGAILPIGEWVLREACREAASWPSHLKVAVNLSPVQIAHTDLQALVRSVLDDTGIDPTRLELEITESSIIVDKERAMTALTAIKALGVSIAIDDFGTGYSSLELLRSFPFDKIKLDKSFLVELEKSSEAKAMVRAILALGQGLRIPVLAEGVETIDQLDILRLEGCHEAQGYLLGRPMPIKDQGMARDAA